MKKLNEIIFFILILILVFYIIYLLFLKPIRIIKYENFNGICNKECCLPGWYGNSNNQCSPCPFQHTSPFSIPDENCNCKNNNINSCFACPDPCAPFNLNSRTCQKKICPRGKVCKNGICV
jgi:hypothetical protein